MNRMYEPASSSSGSWLGKAIVVLLVWVVLAAAGYYFLVVLPGGNGDDDAGNGDAPKAGRSDDRAQPIAHGQRVRLGIAYGTEKRNWLEWAAREFAKSPEGQGIELDLQGLGSLESAHKIVEGDQSIHVWSPASGLYREEFELLWKERHSGDPIAEGKILALSPMVFVMWKERYDAFLGQFGDVSFKTLGEALETPGGWGAIAEQPEWGLFKLGHTYPNESNSGLMTLVLMAYDFHDKRTGLTLADVVNPKFQAWMQSLESGVSGMSNSTGNMMESMVRRGPSTYDAVMVYESVAIDYVERAKGRWGDLHVAYPKRNIWNDNPYYILNTDWTTSEHKRAAETFLEFLLTEPIQKQALTHGFRPGNTAVPVIFPESPFVRYKQYGLKNELTTVCDPPSAEVIKNLLLSWQRALGGRRGG